MSIRDGILNPKQEAVLRAVVQRVSRASVRVDGVTVGAIGRGFLVLLGVCHTDGQAEAKWLARKIAGLRIFEDAAGKMNLALDDIHGDVLVVSQFTLYGDARKGRRPSFTDAARPEQAEPLVDCFVAQLRAQGLFVETGQFRAMMEVELVNEGPVTLWLDTAEVTRAPALSSDPGARSGSPAPGHSGAGADVHDA